jgi:uncharacterized protein (DUF2062 family)
MPPEQAPPKGIVARAVRAVVSSTERPHRVAQALALGAFFGFSPFLGLQTVLAMGVALASGLNLALVFVGLNLNLLLMLPYYAGVTVLANKVIGGASCTGDQLSRLLANSPFSGAFWEVAFDASVGCARPFVTGSLAGAAVVGCVVYFATLSVIRAAGRRAERRTRHAG